MKIFWIGVALLVVVTGVVFGVRTLSSPDREFAPATTGRDLAPPHAPETNLPALPSAVREPADEADKPEATQEATGAKPAADTSVIEPEALDEAVTQTQPVDSISALDSIVNETQEEIAPVEAEPEERALAQFDLDASLDDILNELAPLETLKSTEPPTPIGPAPASRSHDGETAPLPSMPMDDDTAGEPGPDVMAPIEQALAEVDTMPEAAAALAGGRLELVGEGVAGSPYILTWELLVSAKESYRPRMGLTELPAWIEQLDGKYVQLTGFLGVPMFSMQVQELLIMRNQWDGCCIGVPPTPYDGVEVLLAQSTTLPSRGFNYGTIVGKLKIDPYLRNDWLLSLYELEDARLELGF